MTLGSDHQVVGGCQKKLDCCSKEIAIFFSAQCVESALFRTRLMTSLSLAHSLLISLYFHSHYEMCWYASVLYFSIDTYECIVKSDLRFRNVFLIHHMISIAALLFGLVPSYRLFAPMSEFFIAAEVSNVALNVSKLLLPRVTGSVARQIILFTELAVYGWFRCVVIGNLVLLYMFVLDWYMVLAAFFLYLLGVGWTLLIANQIFYS